MIAQNCKHPTKKENLKTVKFQTPLGQTQSVVTFTDIIIRTKHLVRLKNAGLNLIILTLRLLKMLDFYTKMYVNEIFYSSDETFLLGVSRFEEISNNKTSMKSSGLTKSV